MEDFANTITEERVCKLIKGIKTTKSELYEKGTGGSCSYFELGGTFLPIALRNLFNSEITDMKKLGSKEKPAIVKVQSHERAQEILALCDSKGWQVIVGIEPHENEDITDVERLLNPPMPVRSEKIERNAPCPCGSGKKYKKCCIQ